MRQRLAQARPSLSPSRFSDTAFEGFQRKNEDVIDEGEVMRDVLPMVYRNADILHKENLLFTRLQSITDKVTVDAKPDFYDGAPIDSLDEQVRTDPGHFIVPTIHRTAPITPNFFSKQKYQKGGLTLQSDKSLTTRLWVLVVCINCNRTLQKRQSMTRMLMH